MTVSSFQKKKTKTNLLKISIIALVILLIGIAFNANAAISPTERAALIALYNSTNGDGWADNSGWKTPPLAGDGFSEPGTEDDWKGIVVNNLENTVAEIISYSNQLSGNIPPEIENLTNLTMLILSDNKLTGNIPPEIGNMTNLVLLSLENNMLTGSIPAEIGNFSNLEILWLANNQLSGTIPPEIGNLNQLYELVAFGNQLTGPVPLEITNLTRPGPVDFRFNHLYTDNDTIRIFLNQKLGDDWERYQTLLNDALSVDFKTNGVWTYDSGSWTRIYIGIDPEKLCAFNTHFAMDLGTAQGLYAYESGSWSRIYKGVTIEKMSRLNKNLVVDFGNTYGIYEYDYSVNTWERIYSYSSPRDEVVDVVGRLVVDFKNLGLWVYGRDEDWFFSHWYRFYKGTDPEKVVPFGNMLAVDFGTAIGLYLYDFNTDTWTRVYKGVPIEKLTEFDGKLAVDFGTTHGLYAYEHTTDTWTRIYKGVAIEKMAGFSDKLAVDFGTVYGIYEYDFTSNTWTRIYKYQVERDEIVSLNIFN